MSPLVLQRNIPKKNGGWTGSALLPLILLSEKQDSTFLVVGVSPLCSLSGGEALTEEQEVTFNLRCLCVRVVVNVYICIFVRCVCVRTVRTHCICV